MSRPLDGSILHIVYRQMSSLAWKLEKTFYPDGVPCVQPYDSKQIHWYVNAGS